MKNLHQFLALLTISGFVLRYAWLARSSPRIHHRVTRTLPHVIDTLFLATGIAMVVRLHLDLLQNHWLLAKFAGLAVYIVLGAIALRHGRSARVRQIAFVGAVVTFTYVVSVAISKSPLPWQ